MPVFSQHRGINLLSISECANCFGKSQGTINNRISQLKPYVEYHQIEAGKKPITFVDPSGLGYELPEQLLQDIGATSRNKSREVSAGNFISQVHAQSEASFSKELLPPCKKLTKPERMSNEATSRGQVDEVDLQEAASRFKLLQPVLKLSEGGRSRAVDALAEELGVTKRTIYRWLTQFDKGGLRTLSRVQRNDRGCPRIPPDAYQLIVQALTSNTASTSTKMIYRSLLRAVPEVMQYKRGDMICSISISTVQRIKQRLFNDPYTRLLFYDTDKRREHLRTYAGEVFAAHANHLWQMDMTRCDVMVCDPETGKLFRPRIHAIIDIYSGCIPGWALSLEEDQTQTDLALLRALVPKPAPYTEAWPVFGTPERLYWDNGKTYGSEHARRMLAQLGIEVVYSKPRVSHTRGKIERFFGTFHGFEKTLPGYLGKDARERATAELRRLNKNTKRWLERGLKQDPGWGNRLLTLTEYQERVMDWLLVEYHHWLVHEKTRLEHFLETVPARTQALYSQDELMLVLARQTTRRVNPDGSIRLHGRYWTVASGELINYVACEVMVLSNQFAVGEEHLLAWREPSGKLRVIGPAVPMPARADSEEARQQRLASQAQARRAQRQAKELKEELTNPNLVVSKVLREHAQAELDITPLPQPELPRARLTAVNPKDPVEELDPSSAFDRHFLDPLASLEEGPADPKNRIKWLRERRRKKP